MGFCHAVLVCDVGPQRLIDQRLVVAATLGIRIFTPESVFILKDTHGIGEIDAIPADILCCFFWVLFVIHHALYI